MGGWAKVSIEEWEKGGLFQAVTDFGNYSHTWMSIGDRCLRQFLIGLDYSYFMTKAHSSHGTEFDAEATAEEIRKQIGDECADDPARGKLCNEILDDIWDDLNGVDEREFFQVISESDLFDEFFDCDYHGIPSCSRRHPECNGFWTRIWPCLCEVWKKELDE